LKAQRNNIVPTRIVACGVFKPVLTELKILANHPYLDVKYLPAKLHLNPKQIEKLLRAELGASLKSGRRTICLYGECFPGIDDLCDSLGARRARGCHCYEMLLGSERFRSLIKETAGTFFLERELLSDFERSCVQTLELYDEEIRRYLFAHYRKVVYVRQPSDVGLMERADEVARFLELSLEVLDADYSAFEKELVRLILLGKQ
jgi:hypothetical protein